MRRYLAVLFAILMLIPNSIISSACAQPQAAANVWETALSFPQYEIICKYAPDQNGVWLAADERIYRYDNLSGSMTEYGSYQGIEHIANLSGELIVQTNDSLYWIDGLGQEHKNVSLDGFGEVLQIEGYAGDILILWHPNEIEHTDSATLTLLSGQDGSKKKQLIVPYEVGYFTADDLGNVYISAFDHATGGLHILTVGLQNEAIISSPALNHSVNYLSATPGGEYVFFIDHGYLYAYDTQWQSTRNTGIESQDSLGIRRGGSELFTGDYNRNVLLRMEIPQMAQPARQLRIINSAGFELTDAQRIAFEQQHPEVEIVTSSMGNEQIVTSLMAGGDEIDILYWSEFSSISLEALAGTGCLLDMNLVPELVSTYQGWIPMKRLLGYQEQWVAIPAVALPRVWFVNESLAKSLGIDIPSGNWDWEEFWRIAQEVNEKSGGEAYALMEYKTLPYVEDFLFSNCVDLENQQVAFTSEDSRRVLEIWQKCVELGYVQQSSNAFDDQLEPSAVFPDALFISSMDYLNRSGDKRIVMPPEMGNLTGNPSQLVCMVANARSKNLDIIIDYFKTYGTNEIQASQAYGLSNVFLLDASLYPVPMWAGKVEEDVLAVTSSPRNHALWIDLLGSAVRRRWLASGINRQDLFSQVETGQITVDEYINQMQMAMDMVVSE